MRRVALALAALTATVSVEARGDAPAGARQVDVGKLQAQLASARVRRNLGWGLALAGIAVTCAGALVIAYAAEASPPTFEQAVLDGVAGAATSLVGLLVAIPGAVLALSNQGTITDVEWRIHAATAFVAPAPSGAVVGARVTF